MMSGENPAIFKHFVLL